MGNIVNDIRRPIDAEMKLFEDKFLASMNSGVPLLNRVLLFVVNTKGKQMRPMFVFLCAKLLGEITEKTYRGASMIELIHTATLVHDDVVDESFRRRNFFSVNALWKNKIAVLVGDYLLSKSVLLAIDHQDFDSLGIVSNTIREMAEGELLQLEKSRKLDITENVYYEIIRQKTATLISACCRIGLISNGKANEEQEKTMQEFGTKTGIAFQIKDDLFDYLSPGIIGKPVGIDIKEKKMTLPLIYALSIATPAQRKYFLTTVKRFNTDKTRVRELISFVKDSGGLDYAINKMKEFQTDARNLLYRFPDNDARKSLELMLDYVVERKI